MRESFVFYRSFAEAIKALDDKSAKELLVSICDYALDDNEPEIENPILKAMFSLMKPQIDANNRKREAGKKGGRPKKEETKPEVENENEEIEPEVIEEDNNKKPKVSENKNQKKPKVFNSENQTKPNVNVNGKCIMENVNVNGECKWEMENVNEEAYNINAAAAKNFFEWYFAKLSKHTKQLHKFKAEYDSVLMHLISLYSLETVKATLQAALEDKFWLNKLFEPKSLERNFEKMKYEFLDKKLKNSNLSEVERAMQMFESVSKEGA